MAERVKEHLPLATKIAREFENIPGLPFAEVELAAQEALARAARLFDPAKGDLAAYAARAMRNSLRDLYDRQVRHLQVRSSDGTSKSFALTEHDTFLLGRMSAMSIARVSCFSCTRWAWGRSRLYRPNRPPEFRPILPRTCTTIRSGMAWQPTLKPTRAGRDLKSIRISKADGTRQPSAPTKSAGPGVSRLPPGRYST